MAYDYGIYWWSIQTNTVNSEAMTINMQQANHHMDSYRAALKVALVSNPYGGTKKDTIPEQSPYHPSLITLDFTSHLVTEGECKVVEYVERRKVVKKKNDLIKK